MLSSAPFRAGVRGVSRSSRDVVRSAVDAEGPVDERHRGGRRSCVVLSPRRWRQVRAKLKASRGRRWQTSIGSPRRAPISRKPLRREGRLSPPVPVVFALAQISFAREPGCMRPPGLPCALTFLPRANDQQSSGAIRGARTRSCILDTRLEAGHLRQDNRISDYAAGWVCFV